MFGSGIDTSVRSDITPEDIKELVSEPQVFAHYFCIDTLPTIMRSPIREDNHASLSVGVEGDSVLWYDYTTTDSGNLYHLLGRVWKLSFPDVLAKIYEDADIIKDTHVNFVSYASSSDKSRKSEGNDSLDLQVTTREWQKHDLEFWGVLGITQAWLDFAWIYPISHVFVKTKTYQNTFLAEKYAYAYLEYKDGKPSMKVYQPFSVEHKWRNKLDSSTWDLWQQLPENGEVLIITSSRKDALCIWANTGIPSVSLQAETFLPKPQVIDALKNRFKYIFVLYDNDYTKEKNTGKVFGEILAKTFGLIPILIPAVYGTKDTSDYAIKYKYTAVKKLIYTLINKKNLELWN